MRRGVEALQAAHLIVLVETAVKTRFTQVKTVKQAATFAQKHAGNLGPKKAKITSRNLERGRVPVRLPIG